MCSCSDVSMLLSQSSKLLPFPSFYRSSSRFRCVLSDRMAIPRHASVTASIGNAMVAVAGGPTAAHAAVSAAITHVAVTAVAIASGACLSTRVECLWPKNEEQPDSLIYDGVDVTGYPIFQDTQVQQAITFARKAHFGQSRKSGEPYVTHCIHTGKILAALVPSSGKRAVNTVVAGILHDVVDDTFENLSNIEKIFGADVADLVAGVSKLSFINQLLRRHRRETVSHSTITVEEASNLRVMLLGMVDDPRVVLIKLADRLHNMRTIYALPLPKAQAVAEETLAVWCSLASRLGIWALKAELEDLCFAVLQPHTFRKMRAELASLWKPSNRTKYFRRLSVKVGCRLEHQIVDQISNFDVSTSSYEEEKMEDLLQGVLPFDILLDRRKQTGFLNNHMTSARVSDTKSEVVTNAGIALESLAVCEEALQRELLISNSYIPGLEVTLSSRLKSLYSIYCKMKRKGVSISDVYDARALRVVVGDKNGKLHGPAVKSCYSILDIVHRLWTPMDGEFDDYIINPKPSGYQSLHTAVKGPDGAPIEVQIRSQRMHEYAEFGLAAHWLYKENNVEIRSSVYDSVACSPSPSCHTNCMESEDYIHDDLEQSSIKVGHPVLRVEGSQLLAAVVISVDKGGKELLVAVSFALEASEAVAERRHSFQEKRWEAYARLYKKVSDQWWFAAGHGDWCTCLEKYTLCRDKIFHKQDQFQRMLPTFIQIIDLTEQEESEYWRVVTSVFEGKLSEPVPSPSKLTGRSYAPLPTSNGINNKVHLLRTMLQWEEQVRQTQQCRESVSVALGEVVIVRWPYGDIVRMAAGSTAADVACRLGLDGKLVLVNGQLVLPHTELKDGDIVEVRT